MFLNYGFWESIDRGQQEPLGMDNIYKKKGNMVFQFLLLQEFHGKVQIQYFRFRGSIDARLKICHKNFVKMRQHKTFFKSS